LSDGEFGHFGQPSDERRQRGLGGLSGLDHGLVFLPPFWGAAGGDGRRPAKRVAQDVAPDPDHGLFPPLA
jgi:hypothetical protein